MHNGRLRNDAASARWVQGSARDRGRSVMTGAFAAAALALWFSRVLTPCCAAGQHGHKNGKALLARPHQLKVRCSVIARPRCDETRYWNDYRDRDSGRGLLYHQRPILRTREVNGLVTNAKRLAHAGPALAYRKKPFLTEELLLFTRKR